MVKLAALAIILSLCLVFCEGISQRQVRGGIGGVRLVNGITEREGRLEVFSQGVWGTVCNRNFDNNAAVVICNELGFPITHLYVGLASGIYGHATPSTRILLSEIVCTGDEHELNECVHDVIGVNNCDHEEDVSILCDRSFQRVTDVRLVDGLNAREGRVEVLMNASWGAGWGSVCDDYFYNDAATAVCRMLGIEMFGDNDCSHSEDVGIICDGKLNQQVIGVRLVYGLLDSREGRLEVQVNLSGTTFWGTVCNVDFSNEAATVVCRMLGFASNASNVVNTRIFGAGDFDSQTLLQNVTCLGSESSLSECQHNAIGDHNCNHHEDVGIICGIRRPQIVSQVRLVNGSNPREGRFEVFVNGTWGTVCDGSFQNTNNNAARVVCRMLGLPNTRAIPIAGMLVQPGTGPIHLNNVYCDGNESHLDNCQFVADNNCEHSRDIGVRCRT